MTVYASVFAALTAAGALVSIPIGPVPIVLQNMFVFLAGLLLGSRWGLASVCARHGTDLAGWESLHQVFVEPKDRRRTRASSRDGV